MNGSSPSIRQQIIAAAKVELQKQSGTPGPQGPVSQDPAKRFKEGATEVRGGWERLRDIFVEAVDGFTQGSDPSFKAALGGLPLGKSWCGIFGTYVIRKASVDAKWDLGVGEMKGTDVRLLRIFSREDTKSILPGQRSAENIYVEPGDVVSIESKDNHHCVVIAIDSTRKTLETIEGNTTFQEIRAGSRKVMNVTAVYKIVKETRFPARLFDAVAPLSPSVIGDLEGFWTVKTSSSTWVYQFTRRGTLAWVLDAKVGSGTGQWFPAGQGLLKLAWQPSGSIELWDLSSGLSKTGQKGTWFPGDSSPVAVTAVKN